MDYLKQLIQELKQLEKNYSELSDMSFLKTKEDNEPFKQRLIEAGKLLIDFYEKRFVPEYFGISTEIEEAGRELFFLTKSASYCMENKTYYALDCILTNVGDRIESPNNLERLIRKLKKEVRERKN